MEPISLAAAYLAWVAATLGVPVPPMPEVYPVVPEQQVCALVTGQPCHPNTRRRSPPAGFSFRFS